MHPSPPSSRPRLLLVEDDDGVRRSTHLMLQGCGFDVRSHPGAASALRDPDLGTAAYLIADYRLHDGDGLAVLQGLRQRGWAGRSVLITAHGSTELKASALACGYDAVLEKPLRRHDLLAALHAD